MRKGGRAALGILLAAGVAGLGLQEQKKSPTYEADVAPIVKHYCLPCHLEESENPSGLALDSYGLLLKGGEHGKPVVSGKPEESILYTKLLPNPPFGKQMPRSKKRLTKEELTTIFDWIQEGAKEK